MRFTYTIEMEIDRVQGRFVSREAIAEILTTALEAVQSDIDLEGIGDEGTSDYELLDFTVTEEEQSKPKRKASQPKTAGLQGLLP